MLSNLHMANKSFDGTLWYQRTFISSNSLESNHLLVTIGRSRHRGNCRDRDIQRYREVSCSVFSIVGLGRTPLLLYIPYWLIVHHAAMYNEQPYNFYKVLLETYHNCQNVLNCQFNKIRHFEHILSQYYHFYTCCCQFSVDTNICY